MQPQVVGGVVRPMPAVPERVGSYVLVRRIGSGGMAEVWLGRHVVSGGVAASASREKLTGWTIVTLDASRFTLVGCQAARLRMLIIWTH